MARGDRRLVLADEDEIWEWLRAGHAAKPTARALGWSTSGMRGYLVRCGGIRKAALVADALAAKITTLPASLTPTLTWDQGHEMAEHVRFTQATGVEVCFCDPKSPWQRGSNENT